MSSNKINVNLVGDKSLSKRPMRRVTKHLSKIGADIKLKKELYPPIKIKGVGNAVPLSFDIHIPSAQIKSAIILSALNTNGTVKIKGRNIQIDADENINIESKKNVRIHGKSSIFFDTPNLATNALTGNLAPRNVTLGGIAFRGTKVGQGAISNAFTGGQLESLASSLQSQAPELQNQLNDIAGNIDTDAIIPKQYLKAVSRQGFGNFLFDDWRYKDPGDLDVEISKRKKNDDFILNKKDFEKAQIIISGENFGCGSSREHAVWALSDFGIKSVIAISFADIFYNNCFKNGLLPVILKKDEIEEIKTYVGSLSLIEINLENQLVNCADKSYEFEIDPSRKFNLINGIDDISKTLEYQNDIISYENKRKKNKPWLI